MNHLPDVFSQEPCLTSDETSWREISLERYNVPPGETSEVVFEHPIVVINLGRGLYAEQVLNNKSKKDFLFNQDVVICPSFCSHLFRWQAEADTLMLNLKQDLVNRSAYELLGTESVELIPHFCFQDGLIQNIGLALLRELQSNRAGGRLYAETMANALAIYLLQRYSNKQGQVQTYQGGLSQSQLKLVTDYINDNLTQRLGLEELAELVQLSTHHFSRSFKKSTGHSPHQYVIRQRVERAKHLLLQGRMSISEIALACGFTHQSHLNRHCKRLLGLTPKEILKS